MTGDSWNETYRFSHPVTMPRDMVGSSLVNREVWDRYRGGSWAATRMGVAPRDIADVNFNPAAGVYLIMTNENLRDLLYVGHAHTQPGEDRPDHMRQGIARILGDYQSPADTIGPEGRMQQQANAGRAFLDVVQNPRLTLDAALRAIIRQFPSTIPRITSPAPEPVIPRDIMPTPQEMIRFQQVLPLPTNDDNRSIMDWWYEVRVMHAEARREAREHPQREFRGPTAETPTLSAIGSEITLAAVPVVDLTGIEETRTSTTLRTVRSQAFINQAEWVYKYDMHTLTLEILGLEDAMEIVRHQRRGSLAKALTWLREQAAGTRTILIAFAPAFWNPTRTAPSQFPGDAEDLVPWVSRMWRDTPASRLRNRAYLIPVPAAQLHPSLAHLARKVGIASLVRWDYWQRDGTLKSK
jgi:hypothetical protein